MPQYVDNQCVGANLWGNFEEWRLENQPGQISEQVREAFADPDLDLPRIESYLIKLASATEDFFSFLTEASRR